MRVRIGHLLVLLSSVGLASCGLFNTGDSEQSQGRGTKVFDPYAGPESGAIRLTLQLYNGCAIRANGEFASKGNANIPYPADSACKLADGFPYPSNQPPNHPRTPIPLIAGTTYFLHQLTFLETVSNLHNDPGDMNAVVDWMKTKTRFKALDWSGLGITADRFVQAAESIQPFIYDHRVEFGNAAWLNDKSDKFLVEVLDVDGNVRQSIEYLRNDFLLENPLTHTQLFWVQGGIGPPQYPGDVTPHPVPAAPPSFPPAAPQNTQTMVRFDMEVSTRPTKSFKLDAALIGDGAIRVTWSKMAGDPFYFPVTFIRSEDVPATCYKGDDPTQRVPCFFGSKPEVAIAPPANGKFFVPGEAVQFKLSVKDGNGNYIHDPDRFWSWNEFATGNANGVLYNNRVHLFALREADSIMGWQISGPKHLMRPSYELDTSPFFFTAWDSYVYGSGYGSPPFNFIASDGLWFDNAISNIRDIRPPTNHSVTLPMDAKPGTYTIYFKSHRQFMGEDFTKMIAQDIQVGLPTDTESPKTEFPGRVGNCQICHRGVISLENIRHGIDVNYVEGCKSCHNRNAFPGGGTNPQKFIHTIHSSSKKYPQLKNDCTFCHLTRESALRPSLLACATCHVSPHGNEFFKESLESGFLPEESGRWGNCASQCHQNTPPRSHILPSQ